MAVARWRSWLALGIALAMAGGGYWIWTLSARPPEDLQTVTVARSDIEQSITAVGSLQPKHYVDVGTQVSGQLKRVHVEIGQRVAKGELLAEIDPTRYEATVRNDRASLASLKAQLQQQQAELEYAEQQLSRNRNLYAEKAVSQSTMEQAESSARVAAAKVAATRAGIEAAQATLDSDLANLSYTRIYSPIAGTVISQTTLEGQTVNAAQSAPVIVRVANLDVMTVWAEVAEADVTKVQPGMQAYFTTLGTPDRKWRGTVRQVQPTPQTENDVVLYNVLVDVENPEHELLPSMTVQAFFVLGSASDVPTVAMSALQRDGSGSGGYVATVLTERGPERREVKIGLSNRTTAQVLQGLEVGERIVVASAQASGKQAASARPPMMPRL